MSSLNYVASAYWQIGYAEYDWATGLAGPTLAPTPFSDLQKLAPSAIIELFELQLYADKHGSADTYRFHAGCNGAVPSGDIVWAGYTYQRMPIEADGFEYSGTGQLPRPKIRVSNLLGTISAILVSVNSAFPGSDLTGARVVRRRTLARFLDHANFPDRKNLFLNSDAFNTATWTKTRSIVSPNVILSPFGELTGDKLAEDTSVNNTHQIEVTASGLVQDLPYCFSVYAQAGERSIMRMDFGSAATFGFITGAVFDLAHGKVLTDIANLYVNTGYWEDNYAVGDHGIGEIHEIGNGWYRCAIVATPIAAGSSSCRILLQSNANTTSYTGNGDSGIYLSSAQLEQSSAPTEYQGIGASFQRNPYGTPDPGAEFPQEIYYIDRKTAENREMVEWELAAVFDLAGVYAPKRQCISNVCQWNYRVYDSAAGAFSYTNVLCPYSGASYFDENDTPVGTPQEDVCGKTLDSCRARFGTTAELPFGSFPGIGTYFA